MAQTYTIESVSELEPTTWFDKAHNSTIYYIKVKISGHPKIVEIGKKAPDALKAGMTVYGDILPQDNPAFADKFKAVQQNPSYSGGNSAGKSSYTRDDDAIRAQWAIGQANTQLTALVTSGGMKADGVTWDEIEKYAKQFYAMIDRVKGSDTPKDDEPRYTDDDAQQAPSDIPF